MELTTTLVLSVTIPMSADDVIQPVLFRAGETVRDALLDYGIGDFDITLKSVGERVEFTKENKCGA